MLVCPVKANITNTNYKGINITAIHGSENVCGFHFIPKKWVIWLKILKNFLLFAKTE